MRRTAALAVSTVLAATAATAVFTGTLASANAPATGPAAERPAAKGVAEDRLRDVMFVGNNWDGTADVVDARTHQRIKRINVIPDEDERMAEIATSPDKLAFFLAVQQGIGEGHNQYVDDMFSTHDGTLVAVSRPSFADVVGIDLRTEEIVWRFPMEGYRSDHMGVSPDGTKLLVSDSTARKVHELDLRTGEKLREFASDDTPHENNYTQDGDRIFHASIGRVYTPTDREELGLARDTSKGDRFLQIVDNQTFDIDQRWDMGRELEEAGYPGMSSAVRPMAVAPAERYVYLQVSFLHGFVEFDTEAVDEYADYEGDPRVGKVTRVVNLPISEEAASTPREQYVLDSAHHGMAMNEAGTKLCVAGTMSDYAAIVERESGRHTVLKGTEQAPYTKPYWSTNGADNTCWVSMSGSDMVAVIDYETGQPVATVPVGDHPQRVREGFVGERIVRAWENADR